MDWDGRLPALPAIPVVCSVSVAIVIVIVVITIVVVVVSDTAQVLLERPFRNLLTLSSSCRVGEAEMDAQEDAGLDDFLGRLRENDGTYACALRDPSPTLRARTARIVGGPTHYASGLANFKWPTGRGDWGRSPKL